jgi:uncharacterized protein YqeY
MTLMERIGQDIAAAMKARDQARLSPLRMAKAALMNREVEKGRALDQAEAEQVLASLIKQRRDSIEQFTRGGRDDLVARETGETAVDAAIAEPGATNPKDLGRVMKTAMGKLAGRTIDGRQVNELVRRRLGG